LSFLGLSVRDVLRSTPVQLDLRLMAWRKRRALALADARYAAWFQVAYGRSRQLPPLREVAALSMREVQRYRDREADAERRWRLAMADLQAAARAARAAPKESG
jgi:hypothetical protein